MTNKEQIIKDFSELNEDAKSRWDYNKLLELCDYKEDGDKIRLTVGIGRRGFYQTYHNLVIDDEGIRIKAETARNTTLYDVINYVLKPIFFGN